MTDTARSDARRNVLYTGLLTFACVAGAALLVHEKPGLRWLAPFGIGSALLLYGIGGTLRALRARQWQPVRGTVQASGLREILVPGKLGGHIEYVPAVRVQYGVGTATHVTDRFSLVRGDFRGDRASTHALLEAYPVGAAVDVYVSPASPQVACLRPAPSARRRSQYHACIGAGCLVVGIALWLHAHAA